MLSNVSAESSNDDRVVRVAEQAERPRDDLERAHRIELVEDVGVLVERRAVADLDEIVDDVRPFRQRGEPRPVLGRQHVERPVRGALRHGVEAFRLFEAARHLVVIAAHDRHRIERLHALDHGVRIGAVADEVAEHERCGRSRARRASARQASSASRFA